MTTTIICAAVAAVWIPGLIILAFSARRAPRGFEDAEGFHEVPEPEKPTAVYAEPVREH